MKEEESILNKKLNIVFVYIFIFVFGLLIVYIMTTYLNSKVTEINNEYIQEK